jgi:hypothetical protein
MNAWILADAFPAVRTHNEKGIPKRRAGAEFQPHSDQGARALDGQTAADDPGIPSAHTTFADPELGVLVLAKKTGI